MQYYSQSRNQKKNIWGIFLCATQAQNQSWPNYYRPPLTHFLFVTLCDWMWRSKWIAVPRSLNSAPIAISEMIWHTCAGAGLCTTSACIAWWWGWLIGSFVHWLFYQPTGAGHGYQEAPADRKKIWLKYHRWWKKINQFYVLWCAWQKKNFFLLWMHSMGSFVHPSPGIWQRELAAVMHWTMLPHVVGDECALATRTTMTTQDNEIWRWWIDILSITEFDHIMRGCCCYWCVCGRTMVN